MILKPPKGTLLNRGHPLARGLVICWLMNEGGGNTVADLSGNRHLGTFASTPDWVCGNYGPAVYLSGSGEYIDVPDSPDVRFNSATQDFTAIVWVLSDIPIASNPHLIDKRDGNDDGWTVRVVGNVVWLSVNAVDVKGSMAIDDGSWHQIICVADRRGNGQVYIDGVADGNPVSVAAEAMDTTVPLTIGGRSYAKPDNEWAGMIDAVSIYNRALTTGEIAHLYREPFCMFEVDL